MHYHTNKCQSEQTAGVTVQTAGVVLHSPQAGVVLHTQEVLSNLNKMGLRLQNRHLSWGLHTHIHTHTDIDILYIPLLIHLTVYMLSTAIGPQWGLEWIRGALQGT